MASSESEATVGISITPITSPALRALKTRPGSEVLQERRDERQREVAVDDGRDPGEHLERGLEDPCAGEHAYSLR